MNEIVKRATFLPLLAVMVAGLAWAQTDPFDQPPPPEIEEALRSRITQFYDLFQKGKFREAEQFVAEDSRASYYAVPKARIFGFSIKEIDFGSDLKTAKALVALKMKIPMMGSALVDLPMGSQWAWTEGNWFLVLPNPQPGDRIQTPFGVKTIGPRTAGTSESAAGQFQMPGPEALKKIYADALKQIPTASARTAPRAKRSRLSYSLVQAQSGNRQEFVISSTGRSVRVVPHAVDGWVDEVREQTGSTRFIGWASDGHHRERADQVLVFVDGEANHEPPTSLRRLDVGKFFRVTSLRRAGFQVVLPVSVFDQDPAPVVRVFAITRTLTWVASELRYYAEYLDGLGTIKLGKESTLSYSLVQTGSPTPEESIVSLTGTTIRIVPDAADGWVSAVRPQTGETHFSGWASDGAHRKLARLVVVFVDGEANHERHTVLKRPDVARFFKVPLLWHAGFRVEMPVSVFDRDPAPVVRVFAISRTREASELHYYPQYEDGPRTIKLGKESTAPRARKSTLSYSLVQAHPKTPEESIVSLTGTTVRIVPDAMDGWVDVVRQRTGVTLFGGWASDGAHREPAHQVVVFVDSEANHELHTVRSRPGLVRYFKAPPVMADAGFNVVVPGSVFDRDPARVVRVFAVSRDRVASELHYHPEYVDGSGIVKLGKD
jgi:hypothetical protein